MSAEETPATSPRRGPQRRTAVIAAGVLVLLVAAVVAVVVLSGGGHSSPVAAPTSPPVTAPPPPSPTPSPLKVLQTYPYLPLAVGDCVSDTAISQSLTRDVKRVCTTAHDAEVVGLVQLPAGLKTRELMFTKANALCSPSVDKAWHSLPAALADTLHSGRFVPNLAPYRAGNHTVTCLLEIGAGGAKLHAPLTH